MSFLLEMVLPVIKFKMCWIILCIFYSFVLLGEAVGDHDEPLQLHVGVVQDCVLPNGGSKLAGGPPGP